MRMSRPLLSARSQWDAVPKKQVLEHACNLRRNAQCSVGPAEQQRQPVSRTSFPMMAMGRAMESNTETGPLFPQPRKNDKPKVPRAPEILTNSKGLPLRQRRLMERLGRPFAGSLMPTTTRAQYVQSLAERVQLHMALDATKKHSQRKEKIRERLARLAKDTGMSVTSEEVALLFAEERKDRMQGNSLGGVATDVKTLLAMRRREGLPARQLEMFLRNLHRMGAAIPDVQACPATPKMMRELQKHCRPDVWKVVRLAWKTASRVGEVTRLCGYNLHFNKRKPLEIGIWWFDATKFGMQGDPFHVTNFTHVIFRAEEQWLFDLLANLESHEAFTTLTPSQVFAELQRLPSPLCDLSDHSFKRGGEMYARKLCNRKGLNLALVSILCKHKTRADAQEQHSRTTLSYDAVGNQFETCVSTGTGQLTIHM